MTDTTKPRRAAVVCQCHGSRPVAATCTKPMMNEREASILPGGESQMPITAPRPCNHPGCGVLVRDGSGRCAKHPAPVWAKSATATKRVTGRKLQAMRASLFERCPLCVECEKVGRITAATQRDHIIPLGEGGADDDDNTQALCEACHEAKSAVEAMRGRSRRAW